MPTRRATDPEDAPSSFTIVRRMSMTTKATLLGAIAGFLSIGWSMIQQRITTGERMGRIEASISTLQIQLNILLARHLENRRQIEVNTQAVAETKAEVKKTKVAVKENHKKIEAATGAISTVLSQVEKKTPPD